MILTQQIRDQKQDKSFRELALELGVNVNTLKWHVYRVRLDLPRRKFQRVRQRPNYAGILGGVISCLAAGKGVSEEAFKEWIGTEGGSEEFQGVCWLLGVPVFRCNYREKQKGC